MAAACLVFPWPDVSAVGVLIFRACFGLFLLNFLNLCHDFQKAGFTTEAKQSQYDTEIAAPRFPVSPYFSEGIIYQARAVHKPGSEFARNDSSFGCGYAAL
jgi:hypothetical protein